MTHPFIPGKVGFAPFWALVKRGGTSVGNRPLCRMAWIVSLTRDKVDFRGQVMGAEMTNPTKHAVLVLSKNIVFKWRYKPTQKEIRDAKSQLPRASRLKGF